MDLTHWLHSSIIAPLFPAIIDEVINIEAVEDSKPDHGDPKFRIPNWNYLGENQDLFSICLKLYSFAQVKVAKSHKVFHIDRFLKKETK